MKLFSLVLLFLLLPFLSKANQLQDSFYPVPDQGTGLALSNTLCVQQGCQSPTLYWIPVISLVCKTLGINWIEFRPNGPYGLQLLSTTDQQKLKSYSELNSDSCFPVSGN